MEHKSRPDFEEMFLKFLRKLYVMLITRYLEIPTINAVKADILKLNVNIINNCHPDFKAGFEDKMPEGEEAINAEKQRTDNLIIAPHRNMVRMLLKLLAYQDPSQTELLPNYWEIEHIFPQKWNSKYYNYDVKEANVKLEHLGNKLPLEKKLNIQANNNYLNEKKNKYRESKIALCQNLGKSSLDEWNLENIAENDIKVCKQVKDVFSKWVQDYESDSEKLKSTPTPEEEEMIKMLRKKGLI